MSDLDNSSALLASRGLFFAVRALTVITHGNSKSRGPNLGALPAHQITANCPYIINTSKR